MTSDAERAAHTLERGIGRRGLLGAAAAMGAVGALTALPAATAQAKPQRGGSFYQGVLQPGKGRILGTHYLPSLTEQVLWGYVPTVHATPVKTIGSGQTITIDAMSHEGILEDQGRDPLAWFGDHGVHARSVL